MFPNLEINIQSIISFFVVLISLYAAMVYRKQLKQFKWNQIDKTFDFMHIWIGEHITRIRLESGKYYDYENVTPVDMKKLKKLPNYQEVSTLFITLLNYLDQLSMAYMNNAIDRDLTYNYYGNVLINHYIIFKPFIEHLRKKLDITKNPSLRTYYHLERVAEQWMEQMRKEEEIVKKGDKDIRYKLIESKPVYGDE